MPDPRSVSHGGEGPRITYKQLRQGDSKRGNYVRMFPDLQEEPLYVPTSVLEKLGAPGGPMEDERDESVSWQNRSNTSEGNNPSIPAGYTYLGQFIDHDLTFEFTSDPNRTNRVGELPNARTPAFDLDSVYGLGPEVHPHLYGDKNDLVVEGQQEDHWRGRDLQRRANSGHKPGEAVAIVGDPRNDENQLVAQIHLAFVNLHNRFIKEFRDFETARRMTRWHYQWVVLHDFLPRLVGQDLVDELLFAGPLFFAEKRRSVIPIEFSVAAYRFGHSQVRPDYVIKPGADPVQVFDDSGKDLRGSTRLTNEDTGENEFDWRLFFESGDEDDDSGPQDTRVIDTKLSSALFQMFPGPANEDPNEPSKSDVPPEERLLAFRNLRRGLVMGLPSGEAVAEYMKAELERKGRPSHGIRQLTDEELGDGYRSIRGEGETPLWYWILAEASAHLENPNEPASGGRRLGPVGGRIVAEVFLGLLYEDERSFLNVEPRWKPLEHLRRGQQFDMAALFRASSADSYEGS